MYDPTIGRWISEDPIGFEAADPNLYRYVGNKPSIRTDPSGLAEEGWLIPAARVTVGVAAFAGPIIYVTYHIYHAAHTVHRVAARAANQHIMRLVREYMLHDRPDLNRRTHPPASAAFWVSPNHISPRTLAESGGITNLDQTLAQIQQGITRGGGTVVGQPQVEVVVAYWVDHMRPGQTQRSGRVDYIMQVWTSVTFTPRAGAAAVTQRFPIEGLGGIYHDDNLRTTTLFGE